MEAMRMLYELGFVMTILALFAAAEFLTICADDWLRGVGRHHHKK